jgi:thiol:disulfide interchange protein DsbD
VAGGLALGGFPPFAGRGRRTPLAMRVTGGAATAWGALIVVGLALGSTDPLSPLTPHRAADHLEFERIASVSDLESRVARAAANGEIVMVDFYADWCTSCKEMEKHTFTDAAVRAALDDAVLLQADVTANNEDDRALLAWFGIYGPPTIAFFTPEGGELRDSRVVGFMAPDRFERHVAAVLEVADTPRVTAARNGYDPSTTE